MTDKLGNSKSSKIIAAHSTSSAKSKITPATTRSQSPAMPKKELASTSEPDVSSLIAKIKLVLKDARPATQNVGKSNEINSLLQTITKDPSKASEFLAMAGSNIEKGKNLIERIKEIAPSESLLSKSISRLIKASAENAQKTESSSTNTKEPSNLPNASDKKIESVPTAAQPSTTSVDSSNIESTVTLKKREDNNLAIEFKTEEERDAFIESLKKHAYASHPLLVEHFTPGHKSSPFELDSKDSKVLLIYKRGDREEFSYKGYSESGDFITVDFGRVFPGRIFYNLATFLRGYNEKEKEKEKEIEIKSEGKKYSYSEVEGFATDVLRKGKSVTRAISIEKQPPEISSTASTQPEKRPELAESTSINESTSKKPETLPEKQGHSEENLSTEYIESTVTLKKREDNNLAIEFKTKEERDAFIESVKSSYYGSADFNDIVTPGHKRSPFKLDDKDSTVLLIRKADPYKMVGEYDVAGYSELAGSISVNLRFSVLSNNFKDFTPFLKEYNEKEIKIISKGKQYSKIEDFATEVLTNGKSVTRAILIKKPTLEIKSLKSESQLKTEQGLNNAEKVLSGEKKELSEKYLLKKDSDNVEFASAALMTGSVEDLISFLEKQSDPKKIFNDSIKESISAIEKTLQAPSSKSKTWLNKFFGSIKKLLIIKEEESPSEITATNAAIKIEYSIKELAKKRPELFDKIKPDQLESGILNKSETGKNSGPNKKFEDLKNGIFLTLNSACEESKKRNTPSPSPTPVDSEKLKDLLGLTMGSSRT